MKTVLSTVALVMLFGCAWESLSMAAEGQVTTSAEPKTRLYVRTVPEGAQVYADGEHRGQAPQLFEVPANAKSMVVEVELDGQGRQRREVAIEGGRIIRVEFRFAEGAKSAHAALETLTPPIEATILSWREGRKDVLLGLGSGKLSDLPKDVVLGPKEQPVVSADSGIDLGVGPTPDGSLGLWGFGLLTAKTPNEQWDSITVRQIAAALASIPREQWDSTTDRRIAAALANREAPPSGLIAELTKLPVTYAFKNRFGCAGILQVVDFVRIIGGEETPPLGVKIRYKLVRPSAPVASVDQAVQLSFGPVVEQVLKDPKKRVAELLDLDTGRRATMKEFGRDDRETHAWIRQEKVDVMGAVGAGLPGVLLFDCAVYENPGISWDKITPQEVVEHRGLNQTEPNPITPLATQAPAKLPLICLFQTREGTEGVFQLLGLTDDKQGVKIRYKLVQQPAEGAAARLPAAAEARTQVVVLHRTLELYRLGVGRYPTNAQGLNALQKKPADLPDSAKWQGPYLKGPAPVDPWGNSYQYQCPGRNNPDSWDIYSRGPDGVDGTADDIGNWEPVSESGKT